MFQSKLTNRSGWGEITSINSSSAPGFVPIPCPTHHEYSITNICKAANCIQPLCPQCIANHIQLHQQSKKAAKIQNIITTRITCIEQLAKMKFDAQQSIDQYTTASGNNIQQFVKSHERRLDTAYKKIIKLVDDLFSDMNKQMQIISNAYISQKDKKIKQMKIKLTPLNEFITRVSEYKQQLQSEDYIPALIQLLNQPPKQPKSEPLSEAQNYGSVEINEKSFQDIKTNILKFVKVVVNCKDQNFKGRVELSMNKSNLNGSNNMKFSRFDRSRSRQGREGSQSKVGESQRSNSKKKIFGCESVISDIKPVTGSSSRIQINNNSIYNQNINKKRSQSNFHYNNQKIKNIKYSNYVTPIKITKSSYFNKSNAALWYFKQGTKNGFKASLQFIQTGFERVQLSTNIIIPDHHRTIILPNGDVYLLGGQNQKDQTTTNKVYRLNNQELILREVQSMYLPRSNFGACYFQDCIYVVGGLISQSNNKWLNKKAINSMERYKIKQNRWEQLNSLSQAAFDFSIHAMSSGKIIKFGGMSQSQVFLNKIDIYSIFDNSWSSFQPDNRFIFTWSPGITQISNEALIIFGGRIPTNNQKISQCYLLTQEQNGTVLSITLGPELYNGATFQSAFVQEGSLIAIQNNQISNRNKLIMGYKYEQWKFVAC